MFEKIMDAFGTELCAPMSEITASQTGYRLYFFLQSELSDPIEDRLLSFMEPHIGDFQNHIRRSS
jgi:hypothetical protein